MHYFTVPVTCGRRWVGKCWPLGVAGEEHQFIDDHDQCSPISGVANPL